MSYCVCSGINVRYLGTVTSLVEKQPALGYLHVSWMLLSWKPLSQILMYHFF